MAHQSSKYSVTELTHYVKHRLESDELLQNLILEGEVSNLTYHRSGHVYFALKDAEAQISCALFKTYALRAPRINEGDMIEVEGSISVYAPRGSYQLLVRKVRKAGLGDLFQQFQLLKEKLNKEGLFDKTYKKPIPLFPETIALITSPTGAAVRDMVRTIKRRWPLGSIYLFPATVQGAGGVESIVESLVKADNLRPDVIILGRGGGSLEDLWNFNEEKVVRTIFSLESPVVTGVGHETDITLADFVADLRASTPTAAAELVAPDLEAWYYTLDDFRKQLKHAAQHHINLKRQVLDDLAYRLKQQLKNSVKDKRHSLALLEAKLKSLDRNAILEQGYTITLKEGKIISSREELKLGEEIETRFKDGIASSKINKINHE